MTTRRLVLGLMVCCLWRAPRPSAAQTCDDFNPCTADTCSAGRCVGSPLSGPCESANECISDKRCENGRCVGTPVTDGAPCNRTCGRCQAGVCQPDAIRAGLSCDDAFGICTTNDRCEFGVCIGDFIHCPDDDHDKCTPEICDPALQRCVVATPGPAGLCGGCGTCDPATGACAPMRDGLACNDLDVCTGDGHCSGGACQPGVANTPGPPPTATATAPPGPCVGDCDGDGAVSVSELIRGVNIALDLAALESCASFDVDGNGQVSVGELIQSVNDALSSCV